MTDASGKSFLSYRSTRANEAALLIAAQHDRGIPTWQDRRDLAETPTGDELRRILADPLTANALLWITPDVESSDIVRKIEVPGILQRVRAEDGFYLVPVCAGGISYAEAGRVVGQLSIDNLTDWNLRKVSGDPIDPTEATTIAQYLLKRRIQALDKQLDGPAPFVVTLHTRTRPPFKVGTALALDWSERFVGREAPNATWETFLLPALRDVVDAIRRYGNGRRIVASGLPSIPAATAFGVAFLAQAGVEIAWNQYTPGRSEQLWSIGEPRVQTNFSVKTTERDISSTDLAVLLSVTEDVEPAFVQSASTLPKFRAITRIFPPAPGRFDIPSAGHASDIAAILIEAIRDTRRAYRPLGAIHLFMAVPVGLAMLIGQQLNTFGEVQTYEHISTDGVGMYMAAATLRPSV